MSQRKVVVVGGGVIGAACAHYLQERNWQVTILDRQQFGAGCSHGNCGYVSPSHVLPLAGPGVLWPTLRTLFKQNSPLKIRLRFDPALWMWLARFATKCNTTAMHDSAQGISALLQSSRRLYDELFSAHSLPCEWETRGLLFVNHSQAGMEHYAHVNTMLTEKYAMSAERYNGSELTSLEPALKPGITGGWLYKCDAHLRSDKLMASWRDHLSKRGVTIREGCDFLRFHTAHNKVTHVESSGGVHEAQAVVMATGAWTPQLSRELGCKVPIVPGKGYSITMQRPEKCPIYPMIFEEHRVAITPMQSAYRIGSTMEFAGYNTELNPQRLNLLREGAAIYLHTPLGESVMENWWGWRPMVYDGKPIIGPLPNMENVVLAAGHGMLGLSMSTGTGKLVAQMLNGEAPHINPYPYRVNRF
jgi:D-amino-acid dehydrogenase